MWKKRSFLGFLALTGLILLVTIPLFGRDDQSNESEQQFQTNSSQQENSFQLMNVDSIQLYESTKEKLNNDSSVTILTHEGREKSHYINKQVVVDFKGIPNKETVHTITKAINGKVLNSLESHFTFSSKSMSTTELVNFFTKREDIEYAEPNYLLMQNDNEDAQVYTEPNDTLYYQYQWNLPMIQTEMGWGVSRGAEDIEIAVIDTGVDLDHPDLQGRLAEGYNVITEGNNPDDDNGHGTHVAGVIASQTDNDEGIAGITWFNRVIPIKVMGEDGYGSSFNIAKGIIWATDHGADVINMSLGNYKDSDILHEAVKYAFDRDVVLIAASGNDNSSQPSYPSAYPEVLSVAAVDFYGEKASFSNYGDYVDVTAPGVQIPSTYIDKQYASLSGTSMAAPHVAALAGLIRSARSDLSNSEVMEIIKNTSYDLGQRGRDIYFGEGLIDVAEALKASSQ